MPIKREVGATLTKAPREPKDQPWFYDFHRRFIFEEGPRTKIGSKSIMIIIFTPRIRDIKSIALNILPLYQVGY